LSAPQRIFIRSFAAGDPARIAQLLRDTSPDYVRFYRPFEFSAEMIERIVWRSAKDQWFMVEIERDSVLLPAGFYTLRGLDEGFADPMYGVFIAEEFSGRGLARLTLAHAEAMCRLNGWPNLLLKVDPANARAFALYEAGGFRFLRPDPATGNQVLIKPLSTPTHSSLLPS
jgi:GNAT superfamily N-acetyltransferase